MPVIEGKFMCFKYRSKGGILLSQLTSALGGSLMSFHIVSSLARSTDDSGNVTSPEFN